MNNRVFCVGLAFFASFSSAYAQSEAIYACNYTFDVSIEGNAFEIQQQSRVRDGHSVPFNLQNQRLELRVTRLQDTSIRVDFPLFERMGTGWHASYPEPPGLEVNLGAPTEWTHVDDIMHIRLSIICSQFNG